MISKGTSAFRDLLALAILALVALAFFWPLLLRGHWLPQGGGDLVSFLWPQYSFAAELIKNGSSLLWNPHLYAGAPLLADNQSGVLYPINLLAFLVFPQITYQVMEGLVIFHIWLAGACMYVALRLWPFSLSARRGGLGRGGALLGALAFMFNDVMITHIGNLNLIAAAAWLPLILALLARGLAHRDVRAALTSGVVFAIALLAGHAQMTAITLVGLIAIGVWQIVVAASWRERSRVIGLAALAVIVAFGLSAAQLLPSLEMTGYSLRSGLSYEEATAYSLPPIALASTFSPLLFGRGAIDFWGTWSRVETSFIGVIPLLLAGLAFLRKPLPWSRPPAALVNGPQNGQRDARPTMNWTAWFFTALGLIGLLIALGRYTPIYSLVHSLPGLNGLRVPARFILLTNFSLAALAALGFERLRTAPRTNSRLIDFNRLRPAAHRLTVADMGKPVLLIGSVGVISLLSAFAAAGDASRQGNLIAALSVFLITLLAFAAISALRIPHSAFIVLAAIELLVLGSMIEVDRNNPTLGYQHQAVIDFLRADQNVFRIENTSGAWQPDAALMHGLDDIGGIFNPLGLANYETYRGGMGDRGSALYSFLGAKYVLANKDAPPGDESFVPVFNADPQIDVYLNTNALPRVMLIDAVQIVRTGEEAWQAIHAPDFDPSKSVVIESAEDLTVGPTGGDKTLAFGAVRNDQVELIAQTSSPTMLVLSDVFYPGWIATIDDQPATIYPANFAFRAVLVPSGSHRVVFQFEPLTWRVGVVIATMTLLGLEGFSVIAWRRRRMSRERDA